MGCVEGAKGSVQRMFRLKWRVKMEMKNEEKNRATTWRIWQVARSDLLTGGERVQEVRE